MRGLAVYLAVLASTILSPVAAFGVRGAAERILYYSAYLAEELGGGSFTVAPGCGTEMGGTRDGGRCTFNQFLKYIWAEDVAKGDTTRPTADIFKSNFDFNRAKIQTMLQGMLSYEKQKKGTITNNVDHEKLLPGSDDFYDALKKIGGPVSTAKGVVDSWADDDARKGPATDLINKARDAADVVTDLRIKDMDNFNQKGAKNRIKWLNDALGFDVAVKDGRNTQTVAGAYKVFDAVETVRAHPDREADIRTAWSNWFQDQSGNKSNLRHFKAYMSAKMAARSCGC